MVKKIKKDIKTFSEVLEISLMEHLAKIITVGLFALLTLGINNTIKINRLYSAQEIFREDLKTKVDIDIFKSHWHFGDRQQVETIDMNSRSNERIIIPLMPRTNTGGSCK